MNPLRLGYHSLQRAALPRSQPPAGVVASPARAAAFFHTARRRAQASRPDRYGTAKEPPPHLQDAAEDAAAGEEAAKPGPLEQILESVASLSSTADEGQKGDAEPAEAKPDVIALPSPSPSAASDGAAPSDGVLNVGHRDDGGSSKLPQLHPPPHVHHFDTWTLVRDLEKGGFTEAQAVTIMKAVRLLLTKNMDLARDALVSKSNVENVRAPIATDGANVDQEVYLFRAASSELRTEIISSRKAEADKWRSQRATTQYEVDILSQNMTQELSAIKDELKGLFDDRKMAVRMEQKQLEAKVRHHPLIDHTPLTSPRSKN
jgi:hypothetical protein